LSDISIKLTLSNHRLTQTVSYAWRYSYRSDIWRPKSSLLRQVRAAMHNHKLISLVADGWRAYDVFFVISAGIIILIEL